MGSTDMFDIMLQFHQTAIQDLQVRILNASLSTNLWVKSPFSRLIEQPIAPLEIKAYWNKPKVAVSNNSIELSADVSGGARQMATGRILTLGGTVSARQNIILAIDSSERPYACVETPNPIQVSMRHLKVSYEGSPWPSFLAALDPAKEATLLRLVLSTQLFEPLARLPLTYMPSSLPIAIPAKMSTTTATLPIIRMFPGVLNTPTSVALGLMLDKTPPAPSTFTSILPEKAGYNAAISISTQGLNMLLTHLCKQGEVMGQLQHSHLGPINWHWETLAITLRQQVVHIAGVLVQQGVRVQVQAQVQCQLVNNGCLQCRLLSSNTDAIIAETLLASWTALFKTLLRSRAANAQDKDAHDPERLFQCFDLPGTSHAVETIAQELLVADDQLIIYYTIPQSPKGLQLELPPPKPAVAITQLHIPHQMAQGAPVTIELQAEIIKDSTPPYDYAWTTGLSPEPSPEHGPQLTIHPVPLTPAVRSGPQTLTTVHLKVIDIFGQVCEAQSPALYIPHEPLRSLAETSTLPLPVPQPPPTQRRSRRTFLVGLAAIVAVLIGGNAAAYILSRRSPDPVPAPSSVPRTVPPTAIICPSGTVRCGNTCMHTSSDPHNCGGCGTVCTNGTPCVNGHCQSCPPGPRACGGTCCPSGQTCCGGTCVDTNSDNNNCGACGQPCSQGKSCVSGSCQCPSGQAPCNETCCPSGQTCCGGTCVDTNSDNNNCGTCGHGCPSGTFCTNGSCQSQCQSGQKLCNGLCIDTSSDSHNCGSCGHACPSDQVCVNGNCQCPSGQSSCNGACVDTSSDNKNCGGCNNVCGSNQYCSSGKCICSNGLTLCNGVCVDTSSDNKNCGGCDQPCSNGTVCVSGSCQCPSGYTPCKGSCCPPGYTCSYGQCYTPE